MSRCNTKFISCALKTSDASILYTKLKNETVWGEGIRSRKGFTRNAKSLAYGENK